MTSDLHAPTGSGAVSGDPQTGRLLDGRYRIGRRIARGGMASVYEAVDNRLDRVVAVKIMHPTFGDDANFATRFVQEARAAARLSHPNVVAVYDQGEDDGTVYLAMEYVAGQTLRDVIRKEAPMPPARALILLEPVLAALAAAHRAGVVHRDVKPENVLIASDGRIKVADFGLAKAITADTQHTATSGVLIGTVSYLAPELVVEGRADARADVYAAGVLLYEMLTGTKPHEGDSPISVAYQHVHADVPPPSAVVPGIPPYLDALVARATARDRAMRPADAGILLHQLRRVATALAEGVGQDAELTADLTPFLTDEVTGERITREAPEDDLLEDAFAHTAPVPVGGALGPKGRGATAIAYRRPRPEGSGRGSQRNPRPRGTGGRSRRGPLTLVVALLLVVGAGAGAWWFGVARYTQTPGVIGLTRTAAEDKLTAAGLDVRMGKRAYSETVPAGRVVSTDPEPGQRVLDGGTVTVVISLGKERYDVPRLRGMTEDKADTALQAFKFSLGQVIKKYSPIVPEGRIIGSLPHAGTSQKPGTAVDVLVSMGPRPLDIRDWTGEPADKATATLEERGFAVDVTEEYSDEVAEGYVISQSPDSGTLYKGDTVELVVSLGPELVEMPNVRASGVQAATDKLEALGFKVKVKNAAGYLGLGFVFSTDPSAGVLVPQGSTVTIYQI